MFKNSTFVDDLEKKEASPSSQLRMANAERGISRDASMRACCTYTDVYPRQSDDGPMHAGGDVAFHGDDEVRQVASSTTTKYNQTFILNRLRLSTTTTCIPSCLRRSLSIIGCGFLLQQLAFRLAYGARYQYSGVKCRGVA